MVSGDSPSHLYVNFFFLETPYVTWLGFSEIVHLTASDFQQIDSSCKILVNSKSLDSLFLIESTNKTKTKNKKKTKTKKQQQKKQRQQQKKNRAAD